MSNSEKDSWAELYVIAVSHIGTFVFRSCPTFLFHRKLQFEIESRDLYDRTARFSRMKIYLTRYMT